MACLIFRGKTNSLSKREAPSSVLSHIYYTGREILAVDKRSSLFGLTVSHDKKKLFKIYYWRWENKLMRLSLTAPLGTPPIWHPTFLPSNKLFWKTSKTNTLAYFLQNQWRRKKNWVHVSVQQIIFLRHWQWFKKLACLCLKIFPRIVHVFVSLTLYGAPNGTPPLRDNILCYKQHKFVSLMLYGTQKGTLLVWDSIACHKQVILVSLRLYGTPKGTPIIWDNISSLWTR
jgi:hypothetical protein